MTATQEFDARQYWDKRLKRKWNLNGVGMARLAQSYNRWMYRVRRTVFRRTVRRARIDVPQSKILDIGSGTGFYINLWRRFGAKNLTGVDIADSAVKQLRKRYSDVRFQQADVSDGLPFDGERFDVISMFDVLFHIVDDSRYQVALSTIHDSLNPGGLFILSENFVESRQANRDHYVSRSRDEITGLVRQAGFEIVSQRPMLEFMAPPVASSKRWRWTLWKKWLSPVMKSTRWGGVMGMALYPVDQVAVTLRRRSASMEVMVCRKPKAS